MNISMKQKQIHRENRLVVAKGEGWGVKEGWIGSLELADANCYIQVG